MPRRPIRLPKQWSKHVKSSVVHAIALASVAVSYARGRASGDRRLKAAINRYPVPIRSGVGFRLGANVGYLKYSRNPTWNPF